MSDDGEEVPPETLRRQRMLEAFRASSIWSISDYIMHRYPRTFAWGSLLSSTVMTIGGVIAGSYVLRHVERPAGWAVTSFSIGVTGFYLTGKSIANLCCPSSSREGVYNLGDDTALNHEGAYFAQNPEALRREAIEAQQIFSRQLLSRRLQSRRPFSRHDSGSLSGITTPSDFPDLYHSDTSTDINLNLECSDYSTELPFRPPDKNQGKRKTVLREWSSAPNIRINPMDNLMMSMDLEMDDFEVFQEAKEEFAGEAIEEVELADQAIGGADSLSSLETAV